MDRNIHRSEGHRNNQNVNRSLSWKKTQHFHEFNIRIWSKNTYFTCLCSGRINLYSHFHIRISQPWDCTLSSSPSTRRTGSCSFYMDNSMVVDYMNSQGISRHGTDIVFLKSSHQEGVLNRLAVDVFLYGNTTIYSEKIRHSYYKPPGTKNQ